MTTTPRSLSPVRRLIISEILIVLILAFSFLAFQLLYAQKPAVEEKPEESVLLNVDIFKVAPISFQEILSGFGTVRADREVTLAAQVSGEIIEVHSQLEVGCHVATGQLVTTPGKPSRQRKADQLLKIDPRDYEQRVEQAANRIAELQTEIEQLSVQKANVDRQLKKGESVLNTLSEEYDRLKEAVDRGVGTPSDLNKALLEVQRYDDTLIQLENQAASIPHQVKAAEQRLLTSRSEKQRALNDLQRAEVVPPFDGVLSEVFVEQGQYVRAGEPLVRLTDLSVVEVPVALSFDDFLQLQQELESDHNPAVELAENESAETSWHGYVVRTSPEADAGSRTVQVFVEVSNSDDQSPILPGAFVHARIDGRRYSDAILIPRECVVDGSVYVVNVENAINEEGEVVKVDGEVVKVDMVRRRTVELGRQFQSMVEVTGGVQSGDRLVLTNLDIVEDEREVSVQSSTTALDEVGSLRNSVICPLASDSQ
ncbi:MAG: efflux RND transporter periplasmic adaptor subunit [Fuerstiella sp.]|nr:efflux RND transporter periplasmic adaptor subunit [Fuerstiella sp.]MCP4858041.1 efflux RND transporter periplasmic adaptor subunit [Fuerstiella sp.]